MKNNTQQVNVTVSYADTNRFLLFTYAPGKAKGGFRDFEESFEEKDDALIHLGDHEHFFQGDWFHILDKQTLTVVEHGKVAG